MVRHATGVGILGFCLVAAAVPAEETPSPSVTPREHDELVALLDGAQARLMERLSAMTDEQWAWKETPDRWSVGECVEHIVRGEAAMLEKVGTLIGGPVDPDWFARTNGKLALLQRYIPERGPHGQGGVRAPEELEPTQHWDRRRGITELYATSGAMRALVETMPRDIKNHTSQSTVPAFGWLSAYDWLSSLPLHVVRHTKQIVEVQSTPGYPAKPAAGAAAAAGASAATATAAGGAATAGAAAAPDPRVTDEEIAALVKDIDQAQATLLGHITSMTDQQWAFRENPDRWSVGECVEHIVRAEGAVLDGVVYYLGLPPNPQWFEQTQGKLELVRQTVLPRNRGGAGSPFKATYEVTPSQHWDRARAIREFYATHGRLRALVETMPREIKNRTFMNPFPQLGMLNAHDWLTLTVLHILRHSQQIVEVQEDAGYPCSAATGGR